MCRLFWKSGSLNLLEPSGPVQACNGIALPFRRYDRYYWYVMMEANNVWWMWLLTYPKVGHRYSSRMLEDVFKKGFQIHMWDCEVNLRKFCPVTQLSFGDLEIPGKSKCIVVCFVFRATRLYRSLKFIFI